MHMQRCCAHTAGCPCLQARELQVKTHTYADRLLPTMHPVVAHSQVAAYEQLLRRLIRRAPNAALLAVGTFNYQRLPLSPGAQGTSPSSSDVPNPLYGSGEPFGLAAVRCFELGHDRHRHTEGCSSSSSSSTSTSTLTSRRLLLTHVLLLHRCCTAAVLLLYCR